MPQNRTQEGHKMIDTQEPLNTTGGHCRKSPTKTTTLPPKGKSRCYMMSRKVRSTALAQCRCCVGASSQTINFASWNSSIESLCPNIEHIESLPMAIGILKTECEVRPPSNRKVVMSKEATSMATCPSHRTNANNMLYTKVLCDPPKLSKKNTTPWAIALNTTVTVVSWQMLSHERF
ncbi:unnamed protein product [Sphagnum jensenii]